MLFLFNDRIVELDSPEARLSSRWRSLGCGDPAGLMARDALEFVQRVWREHDDDGMQLDAELICDLGALIVAKTGANAALFQSKRNGRCEPRLTVLPEAILAALMVQRAAGGPVDLGEVWREAA
ncbi:MAG: hypothetical protein AAFX03_08665 [Pseudomonadota bacterium]